MLDGLILFHFLPKYVSSVVFKGSILGGARQFWGNPYLNSTTVLFDIFMCPLSHSHHCYVRVRPIHIWYIAIDLINKLV